jgi:type IV pilus assembly protein PilW
MIVLPARRIRRLSHRPSGFTLIELMVAIAVALFLVGGLLVILQNVGRTRNNQALLAQLQDNQRTAMTLITDIVQAAGYFPDPTANTLTGSLPEITVSEATVAAGQSLYGTHVDADPGDTLTARFTMASGDTIINCIGGTNTSGAVARYVNTFSVTGGRLACSLNGAAASPLVEGIKRMDVRYGVKRNTTDDNNNVDTYLRADQMAAADWGNVSSVKVRLTFDNPLAGQAGQPATIQFTRTIAVMARTGVKL